MRKLLAVLSVALVTSVTAAVLLWQELRDERARSAALAARVTVTPMADSGSAGHAPAKATPSAANAGATSPARDPTAVENTSRVVRGTQEEWDSYQRRLMQDPKYRDARREERRLQLSARRDDAIRLLGFTPQEADAVIGLWVDREMRWQGEPAPVVDVSQEGLRLQKEKNEAAEREHQELLRALLGEPKRARWQNYLESLSSRSRVDQLRAQLTGADALRDDQQEPLVSALHAERSQIQRELIEYRDTLTWEGDARPSHELYAQRKIELIKAANHRAHSAAAAILSAVQLRRFDDLLNRDVEREEAVLRISRIQSKLASSNPAVAGSQ